MIPIFPRERKKRREKREREEVKRGGERGRKRREEKERSNLVVSIKVKLFFGIDARIMRIPSREVLPETPRWIPAPLQVRERTQTG